MFGKLAEIIPERELQPQADDVSLGLGCTLAMRLIGFKSTAIAAYLKHCIVCPTDSASSAK